MRVGLLTISDRGATGEYVDRSGALMAKMIRENTPWEITHQEIVPDELDAIVNTLNNWCDIGVNLVLTSGGTGFAPRDITPEATLQVIEREAPGIAEALRAESLKVTRHAMLSRGVAGIKRNTLIINLPGSPKAVRENFEVLLPILPHGLDLLSGAPGSEKQHRTV
ncbi:MAG: MogA/MoaB family molybdenum cofactor biosynthesis protein [Candidatus Promineifilaceae bacterium]|nr:MogA/MoaB family molybdenum cofactor biosynthesis protein [Candidatus Promineifilaceae bacterium]